MPPHTAFLAAWTVGGLFLTFFSVYLALIAHLFSPDIPMIDRPVLTLISVLVISGGVYLTLISGIGMTGSNPQLLAWVFAIGLVMRVVFIPSTPMLEDDFYRYLWDGAVVSEGVNPYTYSPLQIMEADNTTGNSDLDRLHELAASSSGIITRINFPQIRTIYPPVTQAFFALAYMIRPWSMTSWRIVLLAMELVSFVLFLNILSRLKRSLLLIAVYWWNPLAIYLTMNIGHMDVLVFPFLLGAILLYLGRRFTIAGALLACATAVKLWPVLLVPVFLRHLSPHPKALLKTGFMYVATTVLLFLPLITAAGDKYQSYRNYGARWELNDSLFRLFVAAAQAFDLIMGIHPGNGQMQARLLVLLLTAAIVVWSALEGQRNMLALLRRCVIILAVTFFISPTQFPWYYMWMLCLLVFIPSFPLLLLTATLPLYYLWYYFDARGDAGIFHYGVVWVEYLPVWIVFGWFFFMKDRKNISGRVTENADDDILSGHSAGQHV